MQPCGCGQGAEQHSTTVCHVHGRGTVAKPDAAEVDAAIDQLAEWAREPECPDWCMSSWCAVQPVVNPEGRVWQWDGFHVTDVRAVDVEYGYLIHLGVGSNYDAANDAGVYLRVATNEDQSDVMTMILTEAEARTLAKVLDRTLHTLPFVKDSAAAEATR